MRSIISRSVRLAKLAKENGVQRFLFSSSCSTYGAAGPEALLNEEAELRPVTAYGRSKVLVEQDVAKLADSSFSPTFLRNAHCIWSVTTATIRSGAQQLGRLGRYHRTYPYQKRRHTLAANRAHRRYLPCFRCGVERPQGFGSRRGIQRGQHAGKLSNP